MDTLTFDAPTGTFQSPALSAYLWALSADEGPCCRYGFVKIDEETSLGRFGKVDELLPEHEVLVRQARFLRCLYPNVTPHVRLCLFDGGYGRNKGGVWYAVEFERGLLREAEPIPGPIIPRDVLPARFFERAE
jgi:hypothetical protein